MFRWKYQTILHSRWAQAQVAQDQVVPVQAQVAQDQALIWVYILVIKTVKKTTKINDRYV
jgi:hypothetical protein